MSTEAEMLARNLERYTASRANMEKKRSSPKFQADANVQDWTTREIARLDELISGTQAKLDALSA